MDEQQWAKGEEPASLAPPELAPPPSPAAARPLSSNWATGYWSGPNYINASLMVMVNFHHRGLLISQGSSYLKPRNRQSPIGRLW